MNSGYKPARVLSPGKVLIRELEARGWTQRDLAEIIDRPYQAVNEIINCNKLITPDTARELARAFGTSIDFWINLETNYRLHLAEKDEKERSIIRRSKLYSIAPVREMIRRSWIEKTDNIDQLEKNVCAFLGISSPNSPLPAVANLRHSQGRDSDTVALNAWVQRVKQIAKRQTGNQFDGTVLKNAIPEILSYAADDQLVSRVPVRLLELGVHFVVVSHLPRTYLDGAVIMDDGHPIIVLTLRYDRIDSFWFTLMHEIAHIVLGHEGILLDNTEEGHGSATEKDEDDANTLAREWLISKPQLTQFIDDVRPHFSKVSIDAFSKRCKRHPGIVLGQLHHTGVGGYQNLRSLLVKVGPYLAEWTSN
ncbi:MAG: ImmA/IrrE family metallo-endopeptidase [Chloroflexota bacterium]